jgi:hypothetical protein
MEELWLLMKGPAR